MTTIFSVCRASMIPGSVWRRMSEGASGNHDTKSIIFASHLGLGRVLKELNRYFATIPNIRSMWAYASTNGLRILRFCVLFSPLTTTTNVIKTAKFRFGALILMERNHSSSFSASAHHSKRSGGRGKGLEMRDERQRSGGGATKDKIDALGRLLTLILRHMASELNLDMRSDGYVRVQDLLNLNMKTFANIPLRSHTIDDIREAVRKDNKQRFSLLEENGELLIHANQGHTITAIESESLLRPILSADEVPVCVHGTYKRNLDSILQSGLKRMKRLHVHFSSGLPTDGNVISGTV